MALTLRARLVAGMVLVAVVLVIVSATLTSMTRGQLIDQVDARLTSLSPLRGGDGDRSGAYEPHRDGGDDHPDAIPDAGPERVSDVYEGYVDTDGALQTIFSPNVGAAGSSVPDVSGLTFPLAGARAFTTSSVDGDVTYRVLAQPLSGVTSLTAVAVDDVEATISRLVWFELLGSVAILAALGLVGWWVVHLGIRPIKEMTETATRIAAGDLTVRVEESSPGTEAGQLAVALNQMLVHIEGALRERAASEDRLRRFVADASHELRTPVTTIRGYAELYRHGGLAEPEQLVDAMRRTEQEATRMGRLVEDMLTLAKLDEHRPLATSSLDLAALVTDAAADARAVAPDRSITVGFRPDEPLVIVGDEDRIRQVLANVIGNALVHTEPEVPIELHVRSDVDGVVVDVTDHGAGMSSEVTERVTERFFRADPSRSRHRGGSGLGLSIVDAAVTAHGGVVRIESEPGVGTTVHLGFPAAPTA